MSSYGTCEGCGRPDEDDSPRSFTYDYVLLDRSADDDPVWVLCRYTAVRAASLDEVGNPTPDDHIEMVKWATQKLMKVIAPRRVPGDSFVFRLENGEEVGDDAR